MESRILGALSKLDEFILNPQVWTCSLAVPGTSRNNNSENREPTGYRSLGDPCPKVVFSSYHSSCLNDSEQEETQHRYYAQNNNHVLCNLLKMKILHRNKINIFPVRVSGEDETVFAADFSRKKSKRNGWKYMVPSPVF